MRTEICTLYDSFYQPSFLCIHWILSTHRVVSVFTVSVLCLSKRLLLQYRPPAYLQAPFCLYCFTTSMKPSVYSATAYYYFFSRVVVSKNYFIILNSYSGYSCSNNLCFSLNTSVCIPFTSSTTILPFSV